MAAPFTVQASGCAGRGAMAIFFLFFLGMGTLFLVLIAVAAWKQGAQLAWTPTPCTITRSADAIADGDRTPYRFEVAYTYQWQGQPHTGQQVRQGDAANNDYRPVQRLLLQYPVGRKSICYVNPANPAEAVLQIGAPWIALAALLPLIFVVIGGGGLYGALRGAGAAATALSSKANPTGKSGRLVASVFFGLFFLIGIGCLGGLVVGPWTHWLAARQWPSVPCQVLSSRVLTHSGKNGATYSVSILYAYTVGGQACKSSAYGFFDGSSSGYQSHADLAARYPTGMSTQCYVDPTDPSRAVLSRDLSPMALLGLIPLVFAIVGGGGLWWVWRQPAAAVATSSSSARHPGLAATTSPTRGAAATTAAPGNGPVVLKPAQPRLMRFVGLLIFGLIWNGIVAGMAWVVMISTHQVQIVPLLFFSVFGLVGLLVLLAAVYQFLGLFSPQPQVALGRGAVQPGEPLEGRYQMVGKVGNLRQLTLTLEGREEARYTRGTSTYTDRHVFYSQVLLNSANPQDLQRGTFTVVIPAGTMPTFASKHNQIIWCLRVAGDIPHWPNIKEEYLLSVVPAPTPEASA